MWEQDPPISSGEKHYSLAHEKTTCPVNESDWSLYESFPGHKTTFALKYPVCV